EDLVALWNLVKEKFSSVVPNEDKEKALWVELKRLFDPDANDVLWKLQRYMYAALTWKLYTDCGVVAAAKLPILNPNEFDLWKMRIEIVDGAIQIVAPTTAEQRLAKKNELKAR
nr:hypothetical protein [Tanacetum cinerariifolium]